MPKQTQIIIIGFGGHGKVVLSTLLAAKQKVLGFIDDDAAVHGKNLWNYKVLGPISLLDQFFDCKVVCAVGNNCLRKKISILYPNIFWKTVIHPNAYVHESASIGKGTMILAGAIVQPDCIIGDHVILNTNSSIDHDCKIESYAHIAPGVSLAGNVYVGEGSFLGIRSCVLPNISVHKWATIGAGGVVVDNIPECVFAKGVPAKVYRKRNMEEL